MKFNRTLKKLTAFVFVFTFVMLSIMHENQFTAKADYSPVKMYCCDNVIYEWRGSRQFTVYVQVDAASASDKQVFIHYDAGNNEWKDQKTSYLTTIDGNKEIWCATVSGFAISVKYAIKYIGDGITYWDNNNGNDYSRDELLGVANVEAVRQSYQLPNSYKICAAVKNIGNPKKVTARYTMDNWASYKDVPLSYDSTPSGQNFEYWSVTLNLDENKMDSFQFCIKYEVNGNTYWDNNFGRNYNRSFYRPL